MDLFLDWSQICDGLGYDDGESGVTHIYDFVPRTHCLVTGGTGDGKTSIVASMLKTMLNYNQVLILTAKPDERIYKALSQLLEEEVGEGIIHIYDDIEEFPEVTDLEGGDSIHRIIIFDDLVTLGAQNQKKVKEYFAFGRKASCQCFYLTQSFFETPKFIRVQSKSFIFFLKTITNSADLCNLKKTMFSDLNQTEFNNLRNRMGAHDFILVDTLRDHPDRYRMNLHEQIDPKTL